MLSYYGVNQVVLLEYFVLLLLSFLSRFPRTFFSHPPNPPRLHFRIAHLHQSAVFVTTLHHVHFIFQHCNCYRRRATMVDGPCPEFGPVHPGAPDG